MIFVGEDDGWHHRPLSKRSCAPTLAHRLDQSDRAQADNSGVTASNRETVQERRGEKRRVGQRLLPPRNRLHQADAEGLVEHPP